MRQLMMYRPSLRRLPWTTTFVDPDTWLGVDPDSWPRDHAVGRWWWAGGEDDPDAAPPAAYGYPRDADRRRWAMLDREGQEP